MTFFRFDSDDHFKMKLWEAAQILVLKVVLPVVDVYTDWVFIFQLMTHRGLFWG